MTIFKIKKKNGPKKSEDSCYMRWKVDGRIEKRFLYDM